MTLWYRLIGLLIFVIILARLDISRLLEANRDADQTKVVLGAVLTIVFVAIKSLRWYYLLQQQKISISYWYTVRVYFIGIFLGTITPGRLGELGKVFYVKENSRNFTYLGSVVSILADRILDILTITLVAMVGLLIVFQEYRLLLATCVVGASLIVLLLYRHRHEIVDMLVGVIQKLFLKLGKRSVSFEAGHVIESLANLKQKHVWKIFQINLIAWILFYVLNYLIAEACNISIGFIYLSFVISTAMLLSMLPVTIAGIGIRDLVMIFFFARIGITSETAILFSLMYLFIFLFSATVVGFIAYLFR